MDIRTLSENDNEKWDKFVIQHPHSVAWQLFGWSHVLRKHYNCTFLPLAALDGDAIRAVFPLFHWSAPFKRDLLISVPFAVAGGILADTTDAAAAVFDTALELARELGEIRIVLKQYKTKYELDVATDANYYNRELDLQKGLANVWDGLDEINKNAIERIQGEDLILDYPSTEIGIFFDLLLSHQHRKGIPCVRRTWIESLLQFRLYSLALLKRGGAVVAGTMVKEYNKTVSFPYTCLSRGPADEMLSHACILYWKLIQNCAREKFSIFHSGRIPKGEQVDAYRLGWGGRLHPYFYQYWPSNRANTEFQTKRGHKRDALTACWRKLPTKLAGVLGPYVVSRYP